MGNAPVVSNKVKISFINKERILAVQYNKSEKLEISLLYMKLRTF